MAFLQSAVFGFVKTLVLVHSYQCLGGTCYHSLQGRYMMFSALKMETGGRCERRPYYTVSHHIHCYEDLRFNAEFLVKMETLKNMFMGMSVLKVTS